MDVLNRLLPDIFAILCRLTSDDGNVVTSAKAKVKPNLMMSIVCVSGRPHDNAHCHQGQIRNVRGPRHGGPDMTTWQSTLSWLLAKITKLHYYIAVYKLISHRVMNRLCMSVYNCCTVTNTHILQLICTSLLRGISSVKWTIQTL